MNLGLKRYRVRTEPVFLTMLALLATVPVWLSALPLGTDIPQHAAQINLLLDHFLTHRWEQEIYLNYVTPYLLTYFVGALLALVVGTLTSVKILISLSLAGLVLASARLLKRHGCEPKLAIFSIFGLYGFSYQWGFLPFNVSAVFMLLLLAEMQPASSTHRASLIRCVLLALAIVLTHGLTAVVTAAIVLTLTLVEPQRFLRLRNYLLVLVLLMPVVTWQLLADTGVQGFGHGIYFGLHPSLSPYFYYQELSSLHPQLINGWGRITGFFPRIFGWENGTGAIVTGMMLVLSPFLLGYRVNYSRKPLLLLALLLAVLLVMPSVINGSLYSAERFSLLFFCVFPLLLIPRARTHHLLLPSLLLASSAMLVVQINRAHVYDRQIANLVSALPSMPEGQRALSLSYSYNAEGFIAPIYLHSGQWYGVLKNGLVDPNFAATDLQPLRYNRQHLPFATIGNGFDWSPSPYNWNAFQGERYAVFIVRGSLAAFKQHTGCHYSSVSQQANKEWHAINIPSDVAQRCSRQLQPQDPHQ